MKKLLFYIAAVFAAFSLLAGCGSASSNFAVSDDAASAASIPQAPSDGAWSFDDGYALESETVLAGGQTSFSPLSALPENAKLIYTADISLETTEFDNVSSQLTALVSRLGGYFERSSVDSYGSYRSGYYTVRVPAENFEELCRSAGALAQLNSISRSAEDVSDSYYDVDSRLKTQQTKLERLQELLSRAGSMEDIITIEGSISDTELQIEYLTGTLRQYDLLIAYSTVNISLDEVYKLSGTEEPAIGFGAKFGSALRHGARSFVSGAEGFVLFVASNWAGIILLCAAASGAVIFLRRRRKKRISRQGGAGDA